jgi:hypothetical protein
MTEVNAKTFSFSTEVAVGTVIYVFVLIVIIEVTYGAIIFRKTILTAFATLVCTFLCSRLYGSTLHAQDFLHFMSIQHRKHFIGVSTLGSYFFTAEATSEKLISLWMSKLA